MRKSLKFIIYYLLVTLRKERHENKFAERTKKKNLNSKNKDALPSSVSGHHPDQSQSHTVPIITQIKCKTLLHAEFLHCSCETSIISTILQSFYKNYNEHTEKA